MALKTGCTYEVFTTDWAMRYRNGRKRVNLCARAVQPFSLVSFEVDLHIEHVVVEDEGRGRWRVAPGFPVGRRVTIPCADLMCPPERKRLKRKRLVLDDGDGDAVSEKASAIVSGAVLEACPAVPPPAREGAAGEFGRLAREILLDRRCACRRKLPVFLNISLVSIPAPPPRPRLPPPPLPLEEGAVCAICRDELDASSMNIGLLPCSHVFHRSCVDRWLLARPSCPLCRAVVP